MSSSRDTAHGQVRSPLAGPRPSPLVGDPTDHQPAVSTGTVFDIETAGNPIDLARDRDWLAAVMMLLGRLEYARALLDTADIQRNPGTAAKVAAALVAEVTTFADAHADPQSADPAAEAATAAEAFRTAAHAAATPVRRGLFGLFRSADPAAAAAVLADLPLVLERYFTLFGAQFHDPASAVQWVNTSGLFLGELRRAAKPVRA